MDKKCISGANWSGGEVFVRNFFWAESLTCVDGGTVNRVTPICCLGSINCKNYEIHYRLNDWTICGSKFKVWTFRTCTPINFNLLTAQAISRASQTYAQHSPTAHRVLHSPSLIRTCIYDSIPLQPATCQKCTPRPCILHFTAPVMLRIHQVAFRSSSLRKLLAPTALPLQTMCTCRIIVQPMQRGHSFATVHSYRIDSLKRSLACAARQ